MLLKSFFFLEKISTMTQLDSSNWMLIPIRTTSFSVSYSLIAIFIWRGCHATCAHFSFSPTKKIFALMNTYGYPLINSSFRHFCCQVARMKNATIGDTQCISPLPFFFIVAYFPVLSRFTVPAAQISPSTLIQDAFYSIFFFVICNTVSRITWMNFDVDNDYLQDNDRALKKSHLL